LKYGKLHHPQKTNAELTTFQQNGDDYNWDSLILDATK